MECVELQYKQDTSVLQTDTSLFYLGSFSASLPLAFSSLNSFPNPVPFPAVRRPTLPNRFGPG